MTEPTLTEQVKKRLDSTGGYYSAETCLQFIAPILAAHEAKAAAQADAIAALEHGTIAAQAKEIERLRKEADQVVEAIGETYLLDPPDGGSVLPHEGIRRMAEEIERLRESLLFRMGADQALRGELLDLRAKFEQFRKFIAAHPGWIVSGAAQAVAAEFSRLFPPATKETAVCRHGVNKEYNCNACSDAGDRP